MLQFQWYHRQTAHTTPSLGCFLSQAKSLCQAYSSPPATLTPLEPDQCQTNRAQLERAGKRSRQLPDWGMPVHKIPLLILFYLGKQIVFFPNTDLKEKAVIKLYHICLNLLK